MKNTNIKILFLSFVLLSVFSFAVTAQAAGDSLYLTPATSTVNVGSNLTASAVAGTSGDKICAVQGTIVFNNLTCKSITLTNGLLVQTSPTCSSPSFVLAIPKCTTTDATLFTVSSTAGNAGTASISFSGVKLAGVGVIVSTTSEAGNYTVNPLLTVQPKPTTTPTTPTKPTTTTTVTTPATTTPTQQTPATVQQTLIPGNTQGAALSTVGMKWYNYFIIALIILVIFYGIYYFAVIKRKKK